MTAEDERPSLLMALVEARKGGAERLVLQLQEGLAPGFRTVLGFVRSLPPRERTLGWDGPEVGLREILFGTWDIVHSHLFLPGLVVRIRRLWDRDFLWVHTVHYHDYSSFRLGSLKRWIDYRLVFPAVDALVAVSPAVHRTLAERFPDVELVANAIPLDAAAERPSRSASGGDGPVVGTVAMLRAEKGLDDLVRAAPFLRTRHPGVRIRIAGEGHERERLERLVETLDVGDAVRLLGFVQDLEAFYGSLDAYVQPSRSEPFGLAALEAFRYRIPVVVSDAGYLPELVGDGEYGVVAERDGAYPEALADALHRVLDDPEPFREAAERGLAHWRARSDPARMEEAYRRIYRASEL